MSTPKDEPADSVAIFDGRLDIDEQEFRASHEERGTVADLSEELQLLAKENALRLLKTGARRAVQSGGAASVSTTFRLAGMPHPQCRLVWISMIVDLTPTPGAKVTSVRPERENLLKLSVTQDHEPAFDAQLPGAAIDVSLGSKESLSYEVVRPQLSGVNFGDRAGWTFSAPEARSEIQLGHDLVLESHVSDPAPDGLRAAILLRARVAFRGLSGSIPMIGRREAGVRVETLLDRF